VTSIRRRTATLVALSMAALLVVGGVALLAVLRRAMTDQFDEAISARASALQSITRFDGVKVEMDFSGEAMPRFSRGDDAEYFIAWVQEGPQWRVLERSESLRDNAWPPQAAAGIGTGTRDLPLPGGGGAGRGIVVEFTPALEHDEDGEHGAESAAAPAARSAQPGSPRTVRVLVALSRATLDRTLMTITYAIAGVGGVLLLASIAAARWAVARGLHPLRDLSSKVAALGPGTLGSRFDARGLPAELRPIAEQLSALLARLDEAFEREKRFSAAASHELRTPIAELRMLLEVAASNPRTSDQWARTADTALGVLERAQSLCEALMTLSRASADDALAGGHGRTEVGPVLVQEAARAAEVSGGDPRRISLQPPTTAAAAIDESSLASIIGNLFDNALRHGSATPMDPVVAAAKAERGRIRIDISNPAPGVTPDDLDRLFEPFWCKDSSRQDRRGFGLGLAIARALARAHGGDLAATLAPPGSLRMSLDLPAAS